MSWDTRSLIFFWGGSHVSVSDPVLDQIDLVLSNQGVCVSEHSLTMSGYGSKPKTPFPSPIASIVMSANVVHHWNNP